MTRYGYSKKLATGLVATVGTLGMILPPSVPLIIYGLITEQSIGRLFLAGLLPGISIALFFMFIVAGWVKMNPEIAPKGRRFAWKERSKSIPQFVVVGVIFTCIIGGLMNGLFSPTEAGSVGAAAIILVALISKGLTFNSLFLSINESLWTACMILMLVACSNIFGHFLAVTEIPFVISDWTASLSLNRNIIMIFIIVIYLIGGSIIDDLAFMILATPIFYPVVVKLGFDPIWFGIIVATTIMIGVVIPPVAIGVFIVKSITGEKFKVIYNGVYPFLIALVAMVVILFVFPKIATFLPEMLMGKMV